MSGDGYYYLVEYDDNPATALERLRQREFHAGRYRPVIDFPGDHSPPGPGSPTPGAMHASIEEVFEDLLKSGDDGGTGSILDIWEIADEPGWMSATPLTELQLIQFFGTARPTLDVQFADWSAIWLWLRRGSAAFTTLYDAEGAPAMLIFVGMSMD